MKELLTAILEELRSHHAYIRERDELYNKLDERDEEKREEMNAEVRDAFKLSKKLADDLLGGSR
jgi:hypothetical protein